MVRTKPQQKPPDLKHIKHVCIRCAALCAVTGPHRVYTYVCAHTRPGLRAGSLGRQSPQARHALPRQFRAPARGETRRAGRGAGRGGFAGTEPSSREPAGERAGPFWPWADEQQPGKGLTRPSAAAPFRGSDGVS